MKKGFFSDLSKGFTLLEMLVVIGLIAMLAAVGSISYSTAQKKARDARRQTDVRAIQNAMEQYYSVCGYQYPTTLGTNITCTTVNPTINIMPTVPVDPLATPYVCSGCTATSYTLCANNMEVASPTGYCVRNQQ